MVRAILDGRKTQTRRVIKLDIARATRFPIGKNVVMNIRDPKAVEYAPYQKGDVLWVREAAKVASVSVCPPNPGLSWWSVDYRAGGGITGKGELPGKEFPRRSHRVDGSIAWCPSIHMPKWAARLFLRVTDVRVELLQDISEENAVAEGLLVHTTREGSVYHWDESVHSDDWWCWPDTAFEKLWDSINAQRGYGWDANPWVWVYEFERCGRPEGWPGVAA